MWLSAPQRTLDPIREMPHARVVRGGWTWSGRDYRTGDPIDAPAYLIERWARDGYVTRDASAPSVASASTQEEAPGVPAVASKPAPPAWPHKMAPAAYIHRFPDGPDADLARRVLGES